MMMSKSRSKKIWGRAMVTIAMGLVVLSIPATGAVANPDAQAILKLSGRDRGLCVVLGCGSRAKPSLAADLASASGMLVHGIALDSESQERAAAAVSQAGVQGRCSAEAIPVSPLPYVPDLANLVVIEDAAALKAKGVSIEDALKITAPGGSVCVLEGGKWRARVKSRPAGMSDWKQPTGSPGGNRVSGDSMAAFPAGVRWMDNIPMNFIGGGWAACRAMVTAGGLCFTLSPTEFENLDVPHSTFKTDYWLAAHDAFNGLPLWKINCGVEAKASALNIRNPGPLVTDGTSVSTYTKDGLIVVENATGHILHTLPVKYPVTRLILADGVLISAGWAEVQCLGQVNGLWGPWQPKTGDGAVQAFDLKTGRMLWEKTTASQDILADKGVAFLLTTGSGAPGRGLEAVSIRDGKQLWKMDGANFDKYQDTILSLVADGVLVLSHLVSGTGVKPDGAISVLASKDGHQLWEQKKTPVGGISPSVQMVMIQGCLWMNGQAFQAKTGELMTDPATGLPAKDLPRVSVGACVPFTAVDDGRMFINSRSMSGFVRDNTSQSGAIYYQPFSFKALRGQCVQGVMPANGMFYTAQNNCRCTPDCLPGLVGFGPGAVAPTEADFKAARPLEKGPAFASAMNSAAEGEGGWPMFLRDETRGNVSPEKLPEAMEILWRQPVTPEPSGPLATAWAARLRSTLTAPVVSGNLLVTAAIDEGRVVAMNAATGAVLWKFDAGARIDSSPTLYRGRCFFGCRNGWLYALDLATGKAAWRLRVAPLERRIVAFGQVESVWPAAGSVLAHNGIIYASAGQNSETDGGLAVIAVDAKTGGQIWAAQIGAGFVRSNDLLQVRDGKIALRDYLLDPQSGAGIAPSRDKGASFGGLEGLSDEAWTKVYQRRSGGFTYGPKLTGNLLLTGSDMVYGVDFAMKKETADALTAEQLKDPSIYLWKITSGNLKPFTLALTPGAVVFAGKNQQKESIGGYVQLVRSADGTAISQTALPSPVIHQGIAIARGLIFASLSNGEVVCLGKKK